MLTKLNKELSLTDLVNLELSLSQGVKMNLLAQGVNFVWSPYVTSWFR